VEPVQIHVRRADPLAASSSLLIFALTLTFGRGLRPNQWRDEWLAIVLHRPFQKLERSPAIPAFRGEQRERLTIATDRLRSCSAATKTLEMANRQQCERWLNNRAENSHQTFQRREGAIAALRRIRSLRKFASAHASIHNHLNLDRDLTCRSILNANHG
jgi:hypothetical protein